MSAIAKRCEAALKPIFEQWSDAECAMIMMSVGVKLSCIKWRRVIQAKIERRARTDAAVAYYTRGARHLRDGMERFRGGVAREQVLQEMREALLAGALAHAAMAAAARLVA